MIGCIGAKQANEVRVVLVTVGGRLVVVLAEFVSDAVSGGVSKAWLGSVIVAELGCAAVTPWRAFHIARVWREITVCWGERMGWNWWRYRGRVGSRLSLAAVVCLCCLRIDFKVGRD